jgi:hypothetical protein
MEENKTPKEGIEFIIDTDTGSRTEFLKFSDMANETLVEYVLDFPYAMKEWMNRLPALQKEQEDEINEILKNQQSQDEQ